MTIATPRPPLARGTMFAGRYEIIEALGRGGMGSVYRVEDRKVKQEIALKLINPEIARDDEVIERFSQELATARGISHRNVCRMYDLGESEGTHYITMEYVPGEDLRSLIARIGRLPEDKALAIARQVAEGLAEAHHLGIVHRDLKPGNIMVDRNGNAKIMDFGIARSAKSKVATAAGLIVGTPDYMSPEQAEGKAVDGRADIYALGVVLFEMTTGQVPFEGETALAVAMKHKSERPRDPRQLTPQISAATAQIILRCLEKDPERRYPAAAELAAELGATGPISAASARVRRTIPSPDITVTFRLKRVLLPAVAVVALAAAGILLKPLVFKPAAGGGPRSVAVIPFLNQTGDAALDYLRTAIPSLLITSLGQSKYLQVTTLERFGDLLRQSGKTGAETIDETNGFALCRQDGVGAIVLGSFVKAGETFATDIKVYDVATRRLIRSFTAQGTGVQSILDKQLGQLSKEISRGVGLSRKAVDETGGAMALAPTRSMEAYRYYLEGRDKQEKMFFEDAKKDFEKALAIDPECAIAYLYLAGIFQRQGNMTATIENLKKAETYAAKATEKDRLVIESQYAFRVERNMEKRFRLLKELADRFPKEKESYAPLVSGYVARRMYPEAQAAAEKALTLDPKWTLMLNQLAYTYEWQGNRAKAVETLQNAVKAVPDEPNLYDSLGELQALSGRFDDAIESYKKAIALKPDFGSEETITHLLAVRGSYGEALAWIDQFILKATSRENKGRGRWWKAIFDHFAGQRAQAGREMDGLRTMIEFQGNSYMMGMAAYGQALLRFDRGEYDAAAASLEDGHRIGLSVGASVPGVAVNLEICLDFEKQLLQGYIAVRHGQAERARQVVSSLETILPKVRSTKTVALEQAEGCYARLRAEVLLLEGKPADAIAVIEKDFKLTIPSYGPPAFPHNYWLLNFPLEQDVAPRAYLKMGEVDKAIASYRKLLDPDPKGPDRRMHNPIYHYRLAKIYDAQGMKYEARAEYRALLVHWSGADPTIPELVEAKVRIGSRP